MNTKQWINKAYSFSVFVVFFGIFLAITFFYIQNKIKLECSNMEQLLTTKSAKVSNVLTKTLYKTQIIAALIAQNNGTTDGFERITATILDDPSIRNFIVAPNGVVSNVYPLEGNREILGFDYFSSGAGNKEAILAKASGELVMGGPFAPIQGGKKAIVGRLPVYTPDKSFWGIVSVTLNYPDALDAAELQSLEHQGFAYEIWRRNPDTGERQVIANSKYNYNKNARYIEMPLKVLSADWHFRLSPIKLWYQHVETWILIGLGFLISFLLASLTSHNQKLKTIQCELEDISNKDQLTGVLNRRGIFKYLSELTAKPGSQFTLCYIDINKFKHVNDSFGHLIGDRLLQQLVKILQVYMTDKQTLGRIGGDEFIIIFDGDVDEADVLEFFKIVQEKLKHALPIKRQEYIDINFCFCIATYPQDAADIDELIKVADLKMYENKNR